MVTVRYQYRLGAFFLDPNSKNEKGEYTLVYDTREQNPKSTGATYANSTKANAKVAVQFFKYNTKTGNYENLTDDEAKALAGIVSIK